MKTIKLIFFFLITFWFSSCVTTNNKKTPKIDYEKEHSPKQDFYIHDERASDLCKKGWFILNELNDSDYMNKITVNMSNKEKTLFYEEKLNAAKTYFETSNSLEINSWSYRGIAELHNIWRSQISSPNYDYFNAVKSQYVNNDQYKIIEQINYHAKLVTQNYFEAYKIFPDLTVYYKMLDSISDLKSEEDVISMCDEIIAFTDDNYVKAELYYKKGAYYRKNNEFQKAFEQFNLAFDTSENYFDYEDYFEVMEKVALKNDEFDAISFLDSYLKKEKDNTKLAFLHYKKSFINSNTDIESYKELVTAKKLTDNIELLKNIDNRLSNISNMYQVKNNEYFKNLIVAKKAGFNTYEEYETYLHRVDFKNLYSSLNSGKNTSYLLGDVIVVPAESLSITDVEQSQSGYIYLVTGYGQNQLSRCCMVVSDHQLQYTLWKGEGLITEKVLLAYQGKSSYKRGYSIDDCDLFTVVNPFSPLLEDLSNRLEEANKFSNWDFDYILSKITASEYQVLLDNGYMFVFYPDIYRKLCYACSEELYYSKSKNEIINYKGWKKIFDTILSSPFEISDQDYWWLCETFNMSDEFNAYLEKYIDIPGANSIWFRKSYFYQKKNFNTVLSHLKNLESESKVYWFYLWECGINDEKIIKELIQKGLDCDVMYESMDHFPAFIGIQTPNTIQLFIDNGFDINMFFPDWGENGLSLLGTIKLLYEQEERSGTSHKIRKDTIDFLMEKGAME